MQTHAHICICRCGAKLFRATPLLRTVLATPFLTKWVFDCEIIARYAALAPPPAAAATAAASDNTTARSTTYSAASSNTAASGFGAVRDSIYEFPLEEWTDVAGSKVGLA